MSTMDPDSGQQSESQLSAPPPLSELDSISDSSDSEAEDSSTKPEPGREPEPVEWLATSRSRRSTAGNRMKSMLANEEPDSDLELLFAEDEDDQGFTDAGDDSDVQMDSSSDDEGDNNAGDELEGEQELERQAREKRAAQRKRKAQDAIPAKFRKKVRINTAASESSTPAPASAPRPKKKSERTSWLPSPADLPTRASSRKTTRMSKEQLHQQMIEREERRLKQLEQMQKKAARMEALKKPPMTQEDRLREAAIVEKRNSKSLNRWEVAEKQREEERRAKLAALNQRTLKGPVLTFWTGLGEARRVVIEEEKPKRKRVDKKDKDKGKGAEPAKDDAITVAANKDVKENIAPQECQQQTDASAPVAASSDNAAAAVPKPDAVEPQSKEEPAPAPASTPTLAPAAGETKTTDAAPPLKQEDDEKTEPLKSAPSAPSSQPPSATISPTATAAAPATTVSTATAASSSGAGPLAVPCPPSPTASSTAKPSGDVQPAQPVIAAPLLSPPLLSPPPLSSGLAAPASASPLSAPPRQTSPLAAPAGVGSPRPVEAGKPSGVLALPVLAPPPVMNMDYRPGPAPKSNILALPNASLPQTTLAPPMQIQPPGSTAVAAHVATEPVLHNTVLRPIIPDPEPISKSASPSLSEPPSQPAPGTAEAAPEAPETTTRNVIIFQNFDENAIQDKSIQTQILFGRKMNKLSKPAPAPICVITGLPARYKDPKTGLPYHNVAAYRELQRLDRKELSWSAVLNAWVGSEKLAARGVPARFLDPNAPTKTPEEREKERLAQIRAVPPQPQPPPVQQHHQAPPAAVVAAAHKAPQVPHHVQHMQHAQQQRPAAVPQQLRAPQPFQASQQPHLQHQQLARPQQPPQQQPPPQQQQLPNRPSQNSPPLPQKQQQPVSNATPSVPPAQAAPSQATPPQAPPPQSSSPLPQPAAQPAAQQQQQPKQQQQPTPTPPPPPPASALAPTTTQIPVQKTAAQLPTPAPPAPRPQFQPQAEGEATSGSPVAPVEKEPLPTTAAAPE